MGSIVPGNDVPFNTFDELIRQRAQDTEQVPLVAYPKTRFGVDNYELFTGKDLNRLIDGAAKHLLQAGLIPVVRKSAIV
jgi:hypothetical protein